MATNSIYKNINVKDKNFSRALILALENAKEVKCKDVCLKKTYMEIDREQIRKMFGDS